MKREEAEIFVRFASATRKAASDSAVTRGTMYDLCYCNERSEGFDIDRHYVFLRDFEEHTLLIASNFSMEPAKMKIRIPDHAFEWMEIPKTDLLNDNTIIELEVNPRDAVIIELI